MIDFSVIESGLDGEEYQALLEAYHDGYRWCARGKDVDMWSFGKTRAAAIRNANADEQHGSVPIRNYQPSEVRRIHDELAFLLVGRLPLSDNDKAAIKTLAKALNAAAK